MTTKTQMAGEERAFLDLVSRAAFANPFGMDRSELDARIAGDDGHGERTPLAHTIERVARCVERLQAEGRANLRRSAGPDRDLLRHVLLFHCFHRHAAEFDALIRRQLATGDESVPVSFAGATLADLAGSGFTDTEAERYLAVFYQLRRAFFLIRTRLPGSSAPMRRLRMHLWDNIFTHRMQDYEALFWTRMEDFSTLLLGETGTGKGTAAAAIGCSGYIPYDARGGRFAESFTRAFVSVTLAQFSEHLIESELFGHRKGAFTGAVDHHEGVLARCSPHGAIFLDEVGDVPPAVQLKLLRVLQERSFSPVGSHEARRFHGRVIAATNRDLDALRRGERLREDFYYRLCSDVILVPPLRARLREDPAELPTLVGHVLERITGQPAPELAEHVCQVLAHDPGPDYAWPGNVRELEQSVRRILITGSYLRDRPAPAPPAAGGGGLFTEALCQTPRPAEDVLNAYCAMLLDRHGTYGAVARITGLDRRTVRRRAAAAAAGQGEPSVGRGRFSPPPHTPPGEGH